jgi:hypothetical protein
MIQRKDQKSMTNRVPEYERRARDYEEKAKHVTDLWIRQRYVTLEKRCREMQKAPESDETGSGTARIARAATADFFAP